MGRCELNKGNKKRKRSALTNTSYFMLIKVSKTAKHRLTQDIENYLGMIYTGLDVRVADGSELSQLENPMTKTELLTPPKGM